MKKFIKIPLAFGFILAISLMALMGPAKPATADLFPTQLQLDLGLKPLDYQAALSQAKLENKMVMLYFWAVWCGNCQNFSDKVLSDPKIIDALNKDFVFVSIDIDKDKVTSQGFRVRAVPTTIFLENDGKPVSVLPGAVPGLIFSLVLDYMADGSYQQMEFAQYFEQKHGGSFSPSEQETAPGSRASAQNDPLIADLSLYLKELYQEVSSPLGLQMALSSAHITLRGLTSSGYWLGAPALAKMLYEGQAGPWLFLSKSKLAGESKLLEPKVN
ncbi:MAG: thioredoxin family protein [Deltaproteobacteria bacterium]|nr:thioredoxin family protein [Deltaproteobacteria bacterium]